MKNIHSLLYNKEWYHQRFDGSPLYLFIIGEAEVKPEKRKPQGTEAKIRVCFFKDGKADWYLDMADIHRGSKILLRLAKIDPDISVKLLRLWKKDENKFELFFRGFNKIHLNKLSDKQLLKFYRNYYSLAINRFSSSAIIDHFALGTDRYIAKLISSEMGLSMEESRFTEIFSIATAPAHQSFMNKAEIDLLALAIHNPDNATRLNRHQKKYFWIGNNYITAQLLTADYFKEEINNWLTTKVNLEVKYQQLKETPRRNARLKRDLFKKYHFSKFLRTLLKISEDFTRWQDERKIASYLSTHMGTQILGEMANRRSIAAETTKYLVPSEVEKWFLKGKPSNEILFERINKCAVVFSKHGYFIATGKEVENLQRMMFPPKMVDQVQDLRGLSASLGVAIGQVKVVKSVQEIAKVHPGDILVSVMTRPDYISAMRKAAAIVTNEGGITCHAAIIARELGIPCVIGTKIATEIFHDGEMVEVNANHGVVTRLKK